MTDSFHDAKIRFSRAKEHFIDLQKRIKVFFETKPYKFIIDTDSEGWVHVHKIKFTKPFPDDFTAVATDVVDNLRCALDLAWYAAAVLSGSIDRRGNAYFPFADSKIEFEKMIKRGFNNFCPGILTLLRAFKPYKGGNNLLWALNRICVTNKHEMLAPAAIKVDMGFPYVRVRQGRTEIITPKWDRRNNEIIFFITFKDDKIDYNLKFALDIAFDKIEIVGGQPVIAILYKLIGLVEKIITLTERRTHSLGFI